ncbi:glycoside hydrolase, partial [Aureobasidium melanogenum]
KQAGKLYFGTAADVPGTNETTDKYYRAELANRDDWGQVTPANAMKWVFTEPEQGVFNYTEADIFLADAAPPGRLVRCHNLNWYNQLPEWLTSGTWTNETLTKVLQNHVTNLVEHFGDRCYAWDVVNEALSDSGTGNLADNTTWRSDIWYNTIGPGYVAVAFKAAEAAVKAKGLKVKLYYNDYNIESAGPKSTAAQALVKSLKDAGIQIDGVGLQSHFIVGETPSKAAQ